MFTILSQTTFRESRLFNFCIHSIVCESITDTFSLMNDERIGAIFSAKFSDILLSSTC